MNVRKLAIATCVAWSALSLIGLGCASPDEKRQAMLGEGGSNAGALGMGTSGHNGAAGVGASGGAGAGGAAGTESAIDRDASAEGASDSGSSPVGIPVADGGEACPESACDGIACGVAPFCERFCGRCAAGSTCNDGQCIAQPECGDLMLELETYASCALEVAPGTELDGQGFIDADGRQQRVLALDRWGTGHVIAWCDSSTLSTLVSGVNARYYLGRSDSARIASFGDDFMCNPASFSSNPLPSYVTYLGLGLPAEYRDDPAALAADWDAIIYCGFRAEWDDAWVPTLQAFVSEHGGGLLASLDYAGVDVTPPDFAHANALIAPTGMTFLEVLNYAATAAVAVDGQCVPDLVVY